MSPNTNTPTRRDFLTAIFGEEFSGFIEIRELNSTPVQNFYTGINEIVDKRYHGNTYFGVCLRDKQNGTKKDIKQVHTLWVDIDKPFAEATKILLDFEFLPSIVVSSGNGLHAYWLLREPASADSRVEGILKGLSTHLQGDSCWDLSRILRLPFTNNVKDAAHPKPVTIEVFEPDVRYSLADFETYETEITNIDVQKYDFTIQDVDIYSLPITSEWKTAILNGKHPKKNYKSRSELDQATMNVLAYNEIDDETAYSIFHNEKNKISTKTLTSHAGYFNLTWSKAKAIALDEKKIEAEIFATPLSLEAFLKSDIPPIEYYISEMLPKKGKTMISAQANTGKSLFAQNLAIQMASGEDKFMDRFTTTNAKVLYLDLEMGDAALKSRFETMGCTGSQNLFVKFLPVIDLLDPEHQAFVEGWIKDLKIDVLIIDPLGNAWCGDENNKQEVGQLTSYLNTLIAKYNISVVVIHHWRKATKDFRQGGEMAAGSYRWAAWLDYHITLQGTPDKVTVSCEKSRHGKKFSPFLAKLDTETLQFKFLTDFEVKFTESTLEELFESFGLDEVPMVNLIAKAKELKKGCGNTIRGLVEKSADYMKKRVQKSDFVVRRPKNEIF